MSMHIYLKNTSTVRGGFPGGSDSTASACNAGDLGSLPGSGRSPEEGNGSPLQYSCLENPMDRGAWWATVHGAAKSRTRLSDLSPSLYIYCSEHLIIFENHLSSWQHLLKDIVSGGKPLSFESVFD